MEDGQAEQAAGMVNAAEIFCDIKTDDIHQHLVPGEY